MVTEIMAKAAEMLRQKEYRRAIHALGEIDISSISPNEMASYNLIFVEANINLGNNAIEPQLNYALEYYKNSHENEKYALAKLLHGMVLQSTGNFIDSKEAFVESYAGYRRCGDRKGEACALNYLGFILHHIGDFDSAIYNLQRSAEIYSARNDQTNTTAIAINLAQIYRAKGEINKSRESFLNIESSIGLLGDRRICQYYMMSSIPFLLLYDIDSARERMRKAEPYLGEFIREKAIYFEYWGRIHNLEGDYGQALNTLQRGLDISLDIGPESALVSQTKRLMADAYFGLGQFDAARKFADSALAVAESLNERAEIACCHRIYARLEASADNPKGAREWFGKATDMFSMIGSRYELALTRYLAAATRVHPDGERQALLYLAREYFKSENIDHLTERIDRELALQTAKPTHNGRPTTSVPTIICRNKSMKRMIELAEHVAPSGMSVLLTGATGTGKDLLARYIHHHSGRTGRFVSVNAAAIPNDMIESELFGYRRGAYTGAATTTSGWIEESEGGTFYLNEIADSSPELQAKLLDVIENRRVCRLGERQEREIDCRFIAATNHPLEKLIEDGRFRLDLYHRLNEIPIHLPPLSERREDIELLLGHFLNAAGVKIITDADRDAFAHLAKVFRGRPWQGNIRQLETETKRLALVCRGDISCMVNMARTYQLSTKEETLAALQRARWNRREVGRILGISESTVRHRIKIYNLSADK